MVPVGVHLHPEGGDLPQHPLGFRATEDGPHADLTAVVCGNHHLHAAYGQLEAVVPQDAVYLSCYNLIHHAGAVHGMDDLIAYSEHGPHLLIGRYALGCLLLLTMSNAYGLRLVSL